MVDHKLFFIEKMTHTLARRYIGAPVNQDGTEKGAEHLEALLCLITSSQLDAELDKQRGGRCLLLTSTWTRNNNTGCLRSQVLLHGESL